MAPDGRIGHSESATDPAAWVADHGDSLFAFAMSRVRDPDLAEELVQDTLLIALRKRDSFEGRSTLRTWLTGILRHRILEHRRTLSRRGTPRSLDLPEDYVDRCFDDGGHWSVPVSSWGGSSRGIESQEFRNALDECVAELPARAAEAVALRTQHDLSLELVASLLDITSNNLSVILHRARTALRQCLENKCFGGGAEES